MNRKEKQKVVDYLDKRLTESTFFYLADASDLNVFEVSQLRGKCHEAGVEMKLAKNTMIKRAMEASEVDFSELYDLLKGHTYLMFSEKSSTPAKIIKDFRRTHDKPVIKAAYIDADIFIGDENLNKLAEMKSHDELIGDVISALQSPINNVISGLMTGGNKLSGLIMAIVEKAGEPQPQEDSVQEEESAREATSDTPAEDAPAAGGDAPAEDAKDAPAEGDAPAEDAAPSADSSAEAESKDDTKEETTSDTPAEDEPKEDTGDDADSSDDEEKKDK